MRQRILNRLVFYEQATAVLHRLGAASRWAPEIHDDQVRIDLLRSILADADPGRAGAIPGASREQP